MSFNTEERIGIFSVAKIFVEDFGWIFREQPINDFGVDAILEITRSLEPFQKKIVPTGRIIGIQIKSGNSFFNNRDPKNIVFRGNKRHLNYWLGYSIPIIIVLYDKSSNSAYWKDIDKSSIAKTKKTLKVNIPRSNILNCECTERLKRLGYFRNNYQYKLWQLRTSTEVIRAIMKNKHFLYIELSKCNFANSYQVSILVTREDDDYIPKIFHCSLKHYYTFYLSENMSILEGINDTIPWVDLFCNDIPFSDEMFSEDVMSSLKKFAEIGGISFDLSKNNSIYSIACEISGEYYFKLEAKPNELGHNFLKLNAFLLKDSVVEQRLFF